MTDQAPEEQTPDEQEAELRAFAQALFARPADTTTTEGDAR